MRFLIILLGLIFGSFGSVIMTRFDEKITRENLHGFLFGYSHCPACKHRLKALDLMPIFSYLLQGGRCRYCRKKIPWIYPVLELLCAGAFLLTYLFLKDLGTSTLIFGLIIDRLLILLLVYDLQKYALHFLIRILLVSLFILAHILLPGGDLRHAFLSTLLFTGAFTGIYRFAKRYAKIRFGQKEGLGEGDVYLAFLFGIAFPLILSLHTLPFSGLLIIQVLISFVLLSSIIGLLRSLLQYLLRRHLDKEISLNMIPFFPSMIIAFRVLAWKLPYFITLLFG